MGQMPWKGVPFEEMPFVMNEKFFDVNPPIANLALQNFVQGCLQYEGESRQTVEEAYAQLKWLV